MGSAATHTLRLPALALRSPLLRLQGDDKLVALTRAGREDAYEVLMERYRGRLFAFCKHMLGSAEDAEDTLQEVYASAHRSLCLDERQIHAKAWLYRIARNRCLNHLRRPQALAVESIDGFESRTGESAADAAEGREALRDIVADVQRLPETQRAALVLREFDALSYTDIATTLETTVPAVKSLLVRARMNLASAAATRAA